MRPTTSWLAFLLAAIFGLSAGIVIAQDSSEQKPFRILCDDDTYQFAGVCVGKFEGQLGIWVLNHPRAQWDPSNDGVLLAQGIKNTGNLDTGLGWTGQVDWNDFRCRVVSNELVAYSYLTEFRANECEGYHFANENFTVTDVHVAVLPESTWIAKVEGIYQGHPDSSLHTGSFREALESRFQGESCSNNHFCRQKPVKQDYGFELNEPEMARIKVTTSNNDPSNFIVTLEYVNAVPIAIQYQKLVVEQEHSDAPVNDF